MTSIPIYILATIGTWTVASWIIWFLSGWLDRREMQRVKVEFHSRLDDLDRREAS